MLGYAEEILLLALDDETGKLRPMPDRALDFTLAGAALAELALREQIRTAEERIEVLDATLTSRPGLDQVLSILGPEGSVHSLPEMLHRLAAEQPRRVPEILQRLVDRNLLKKVEERFLWVFPARRYPSVDGREEEEVLARLRRIVLEGAPASKRDCVLLTLVEACQLTRLIFSEDERPQARPAIHELARHDCISRAVVQSIEEIQQALLQVRAYAGM